MRIEKLSLSSFRSFHNIDLPTHAPRVLIAGVNGTGKTSIREALKWVLTGRCQGTDGKGAGVEVLTPFGMVLPVVEASVELAGIGRASRTAKAAVHSFAVSGFTGTLQTQQTALYAKLETTPAFLDAVLDTETFLRLHHAEAKALVLNLLNVQIALGDDPDSPVYSLAELDQLYENAFEDRKLAKRLLVQNGMPPKPSEDARPSVAAVEDQLKKLQADLETLSQGIGESAGRRAILQRDQQILHMPPIRRPAMGSYGSLEAVMDRRTELEERLAILEERANDVVPAAPAPGQPVDVTFLKRREDALAAHKPSKGCVLDATVPCKTPKLEFTKAMRAIEAELATRPAAPPSTESPLVAIRKEIANLTELEMAVAKWESDEALRQGKLAMVEKELAALPDTSAQEAQIATLKARIAKGEQLRRETQAHAQATVVYERAVAAREEQRAEVDRLELLVGTLGPNGVRVKALEQAIGKFSTHVNAYTDRFGWHLTFALDPWTVLANDRPVETYSRSEQFRIGIALQLAIAALSGLGFAVIDEFDMLSIENRSLVTQMVMQAPLDQVFVIGTREPGTPLPNTDAVLAYRLGTKDGRTVVIERSGSTSLGTAA